MNKPSAENTGNRRKAGYTSNLDKDSRGSDYLYRYPNSAGEFDACSPGADAAAGRAESGLPKCDGPRWEDLPSCGRFMRYQAG